MSSRHRPDHGRVVETTAGAVPVVVLIEGSGPSTFAQGNMEGTQARPPASTGGLLVASDPFRLRVVVAARACPRFPPRMVRGVDGSSPSEGYQALLLGLVLTVSDPDVHRASTARWERLPRGRETVSWCGFTALWAGSTQRPRPSRGPARRRATRLVGVIDLTETERVGQRESAGAS
jgi:hypothetical protein